MRPTFGTSITSVCAVPPSRSICVAASCSFGTPMYIAQNGGALTSSGLVMTSGHDAANGHVAPAAEHRVGLARLFERRRRPAHDGSIERLGRPHVGRHQLVPKRPSTQGCCGNSHQTPPIPTIPPVCHATMTLA